MPTRRPAYCLTALLLLLPVDVDAQREALSLSGNWQVAAVDSLDVTPAPSAWKATVVPGLLTGHDYERAWFRTVFDVPADWTGKRLFLRFGGVKYNSRVRVNGRPVGGCFNGYDAFELDVTDAAQPGKENELLVGVHDWTGVFVGEPVDFGDERLQRRELRHMPEDRVVGPIGGHVNAYGIWDDVQIEARPAVYVDDLFVRPSVRRKRIDIEAT
ncbi:MAG TPA: hypothetical protein ENN80_03670, partial [Candidatus Hydrogenedentes bacterium]|nr:hypothetical protein [Candidatus Hydrogenedentota bacterium]